VNVPLADITFVTDGDIVVASVVGEIDMSNAPELSDALATYHEGVAASDYDLQQLGLVPYVAVSGPAAARAIASVILEAD